MWLQILLPILLTVLLFIAIIVLTSISTFHDNGDVARWTAISIIWLVLPLLSIGIIVIAILFALVYLLARLTGLIPPYSYQAQQVIYRVEGYIQRGAGMVVKPARFAELLKSQVQKMIKRNRKGMAS